MDAPANHRPMRIILLGANGRIGKTIYAKLLQDFPGAELLACVRQRHLHFEGCTGDKKHHSMVFDVFADNWERLGKADVLINCIGAIEETEDASFYKVHNALTALICRHRGLLGNPRIIQLSALGADLKSTSRFLRTKAEADELLLQHADTFVVRPSVVCSPDTLLARRFRKVGQLARWCFNRLPVPPQVMRFGIRPVMPADLAAVISGMITGNPEKRIVVVAGPQHYNFAELIALVRPGARLLVLPEPVFRILYIFLFPIVRTFFRREELTLIGTSSTAAEQPAGFVFSETGTFWKNALKKQNRHGLF